MLVLVAVNREQLATVLQQHEGGRELYRFANIQMELVKRLTDFLLPFVKGTSE